MTAAVNATRTSTAASRREFEATALPLYNNMYGAAMRLTRDPAEAEDLVQDSMVRAFRFWSTFQQGTNIKAWMFTILRNTFINGYHRRGRKREFENDVNSQMRSVGPTVALANSSSPPPGPEEAVSAEITQMRVREALDSLPPDYRLAVTLADFEGLSYKEIAEYMECPIGTVMSRIYRGRKILHKLLQEHAREIGMVDGEADEQRATQPELVVVDVEPEPVEPEIVAAPPVVRRRWVRAPQSSEWFLVTGKASQG